MFSKKEYVLFIIAIAIVATAYIFMAIDPTPNGFGVLTLWVAPPMLIIGFALPVIGITGLPAIRQWNVNVKTAKNLAGLGILVIGFSTYFFTLEPTASLWDCSEFIACAYKLQVPHTPGTPLSLLVGRVFTMFAPSPSSVAFTLNVSSAFFSALCAYVVYYMIYYFAVRLNDARVNREKVGARNANPLREQRIAVDSKSTIDPEKPELTSSTTSPSNSAKESSTPILAAALGSLTLIFSDTFWFSAVEAETYGIACFFLMALAALIIDGRHLQGSVRERRLILIAYVAGLAYCIHPMCVLSLALLPYYWYYEGNNVLAIRPLMFLAAGPLLVFLINRLVAIGLFEFAFTADKFVVNGLGMPFYSGAVLFILLIISLFVFIIRKRPEWRAPAWAIAFLLAGFIPYLMLFIRSNHNPPIDETNPENLPMIKAYMNRESYPSSPLLYGPYFDARVEDVEAGRRIYHKADNRYEFSGTLPEYRYEKKRSTFLPRLYSNSDGHANAYREWLDLKPNERPGFGDNLNFLFTYQLGHMYLRYLMFNFAGRESDRQGADWLRPWDSVAHRSPYTSAARNQYWMLPLVAGLLGACIQWRNDRRNFITVLSLFLITGLVLALYLNSPPVEPRERDYIYVASFIAFCIWIGLSVVAVANLRMRHAFRLPAAIALTAGLPVLMLWQNYDDHNRSGRTFQRDNARNLLAGCAPNAILFTGGDNDTFPLWYLQEVEGFRTDVRVMVTSYLNTDWYINQLRNRYYESAPFALTLNRSDYLQYGPNDVLYLQESIKEGIDAKRYLQLIKEGNKALRMQASSGDYYTILPSRKLFIKRNDSLVNARAIRTGVNTLPDTALRSDLALTVKGNYATKSILAMIDVMVSNQWKRPIYFNFTSLNTTDLDLNEHVVQEGALYRFDPARTAGDGIVQDPLAMYENLITKADYSNLARTDVQFNYEDHVLRMISPLRQSFNALAVSFLNNGDEETARSVMEVAKEKLYAPHLYPTFSNLEAAGILDALGDRDSAAALCSSLFSCHVAELRWQRDNNRPIDDLDHLLAQRAAQVLAQLGDNQPQQELGRLGL